MVEDRIDCVKCALLPDLWYGPNAKDCRCYNGEQLLAPKVKVKGIWVPDYNMGCMCTDEACNESPGRSCMHDNPPKCECDATKCNSRSMKCRPNKARKIKSDGKTRARQVCACRFGYKPSFLGSETCVCDDKYCKQIPGSKCSDDEQFCEADKEACKQLTGRKYEEYQNECVCTAQPCEQISAWTCSNENQFCDADKEECKKAGRKYEEYQAGRTWKACVCDILAARSVDETRRDEYEKCTSEEKVSSC